MAVIASYTGKSVFAISSAMNVCESVIVEDEIQAGTALINDNGICKAFQPGGTFYYGALTHNANVTDLKVYTSNGGDELEQGRDYFYDAEIGHVDLFGETATALESFYATYKYDNPSGTVQVTDQEFNVAEHAVNVGHTSISSVVVKSADKSTTYTVSTDYTVNASTGVITLVDTGSAYSAEKLAISFSYTGPTHDSATETVSVQSNEVTENGTPVGILLNDHMQGMSEDVAMIVSGFVWKDAVPNFSESVATALPKITFKEA
jgi:hypothetical protein